MKVKKDQRGFSMVELIVVIAIIAILSGISVNLFGQLRYANTQEAVETIVNILDRQRISAMSQNGDWYVYIYKLSDGCYMKAIDGVELADFNSSYLDDDGVKICNNSIQIFLDSEGGTEVNGSDIIRISYTRSGVFSDSTNVAKIVVSGGGVNTISLVKATGKNYID